MHNLNARPFVQVALAAALLAASPALAEPLPRNPPLAARGAPSAVHPLPLWYQDSNGVRLEPCLDATTTAPANPCQLAAGGGVSGPFNPALPITFPTNFPATVHYTWANTEVSFLGNNRGLVYIAELVSTVSAAAAPQVFTHLRFDTNDALTPFTTYTITHPYGVFTLDVDDRGDLCPANNKACDIFFPAVPTPGDFNAVLGANLSVNPNDATVGSYLVAVGPPPGFIGDGASRVQVTGSPKGTNFVRIQGPATGPGSLDLGGSTCAGGTIPNCAESIVFTVIGRQFNAAGGPTTRFAVAGPATGGAGVAQTFTVTATDVNGNTTTGYTGIVRISSNDPLASLPGDATLVNGVGTFQATPRTVGSFVFTARDTVTTGLTGSATMTVTAGPVATLVAVSGDGQVGGVGTALAAPLVVRAADAFGNPKGGVSVTFTTPGGGSLSPVTTLTDLVTGQASATATLGPAPGVQTFAATAVGVATPVGFTATAGVPGDPVTLAITGLPAGTTAGVVAPFTVTAFDAFGNVATNATGPAGALTLTSSDTAATLPVAAQLTLGTAALGATFRTAGSRSLTATLTAKPTATATVSTLVAAGPAASIARFSGDGQSGVVGQALAAPLVVQVLDAFLNPKAGVTVTFTAPAGGGASPALVASGADGKATTNATLGTAPGVQAFTAAAQGVVTPVTFAATAAPGAAASLAVTGLPGTVTAGAGAGFTVTARDTFGNVATGFAGTVGFTSTDSAATLPAAAALTAGTGAFSATFRTAGARTLTATVVGAAAHTGSAATTLTPPAAATLAAVSGSGQGGTAGQALAAPFVVLATDQFSNPVAGVTVTFAAPAGGSIAPTSVVTGPGGQASATGTLRGTPLGAQDFSASSAGLAGSPVTFSATGAAGPAATLAVTGLPATVTAGVGAGFTVTARDAFGNLASGFAGTVGFSSTDGLATLPATAGLTAGTGDFSATFRAAGPRTLTATVTGSPGVTGSASTTVAPAAPSVITLTGAPATVPAGLAFQVTVDLRDAFGNPPADLAVTFTSSDPGAILPLNPTLVLGSGIFSVTLVGAGPQTLTVASAGAPAVTASAPVAVSAGAASTLVAVSGGGQSGVVGTSLAAPLVVRATDLFGNPKALVAVTFTAPATGGVSPGSAVTAADGTAGTTATLGQAAGAQAFTATSAGLSGSPITFTASATPGPAATLALVGLPAAVPAGATSNVVVTALDAFANVATGFAGAVIFTSSDPAAVLPVAAALAAGTGTFPVVMKTVGLRTVTVQAPGAPGLTATAGTTVGPAAPAAIALVSSPGSTPAGATATSPIVVRVTDTEGNAVPNFTVAFAAVGQGSIAPTTTTTDVDGRASATPTMGNLAGSYDFRASAAVPNSPLTVTVTAVPGPAYLLGLTRPTGPTALDCGCYDLTARLQDQLGNTVAQGLPGVTVTAAGQARITATDLVASGLPAASVTGTLKADGTALVTVCDQAPEGARVTIAAAGLVGGSIDLTWLLGAVDPAASTFTSDTPVLTAFSGRAHVTVIPRSACGNVAGAGQPVVIALNGPGSITPATPGAGGSTTATVDVTPCPATLATQVTARVGQVDLPPLGLAIACVAPSSVDTLVAVSRSDVVVCDRAADDAVTVTVTPRDGLGADMGAGNQVSLALPGFTGGAVTDAGDGTYTATFTADGCAAAARTLGVTVNGVLLGAPLTTLAVSCAPVDGASSGVSVAGTAGVADGTTPVAVTVAAVNTCGAPARGRAVQLATSLGTLGAPTGTTDVAGTHASGLTSAQAGTANLTATVGGVAVTPASVTFNPPPKRGGGGCSTGGGAGLPTLALLGLALVGRKVRRRDR